MASIQLDDEELRQIVRQVVTAVVEQIDAQVAATIAKSIQRLATQMEVRNSIDTPPSAADDAWGYKFGCDGLMTVDVAAEFLSVSGRTLDRLAAAGQVRKGRFPSNVRAFCRRSVFQFAQSLEE